MIKFPLNVKCLRIEGLKMCQNTLVSLDQELYTQPFYAKIHPHFFKGKLSLTNEYDVLYIISLVF